MAKIIDTLGQEAAQRIAESIMEHHDTRWGGFGELPGDNSIQDTHDYLSSLAMLNQLDMIHAERVVHYVRGCQNPDGGFGNTPATVSSTRSTKQALATLAVLGCLSAIDRQAASHWISQCQQVTPPEWPETGLGGFRAGVSPRPRNPTRLGQNTTQEALSALALIAPLATQPINLQLARQYYHSLVTDGGYWSDWTWWELLETDYWAKMITPEFSGVTLARLLNIPVAQSHRDRMLKGLESRLQGSLEADTNDAEQFHTFRLFMDLAAFEMLGGFEVVDPDLPSNLTSLMLGLVSDGSDTRLTGTSDVGIAAIEYNGNAETGGEIYPRSTFSGLAVLSLLSGVPFHPALGYPHDGRFTEINLLLGQPWGKFYSTFLSFSFKDLPFVERLRADLEAHEVPCYFAPEDMRTGEKLVDAISHSIRHNDRVVLVLSESSLASSWVAAEVEHAIAEEERRGIPLLLPVRIDDSAASGDTPWWDLMRGRYIADFRGWKSHDEYQKQLQRLLEDLERRAR